jgi:hypothetical protein
VIASQILVAGDRRGVVEIKDRAGFQQEVNRRKDARNVQTSK